MTRPFARAISTLRKVWCVARNARTGLISSSALASVSYVVAMGCVAWESAGTNVVKESFLSSVDAQAATFLSLLRIQKVRHYARERQTLKGEDKGKGGDG